MDKLIFLFLIIFTGCNSSKYLISSKKHPVSKLVFEKYDIITSKGEGEMESLQDSVLSKLIGDTQIDTSEIENIKQISMKLINERSPKVRLNIELKNDTIWRFLTQNDVIIRDIDRIGIDNRIVHHHSKHDRSIIYDQVDLSDYKREYQLKEHKDIKKKIMNYNCYKVVIEIKEKVNNQFNLSYGNKILELFVTNEINLPIYVIPDLNIDRKTFFPLEIKSWQEKYPGIIDVYEIKEIMH